MEMVENGLINRICQYKWLMEDQHERSSSNNKRTNQISMSSSLVVKPKPKRLLKGKLSLFIVYSSLFASVP